MDGKKIAELMELSFDPQSGLTLGASVPCVRFTKTPGFLSSIPGLNDAAMLIGGIQIQNRASFGGNLWQLLAAADSFRP